MGTQTCVTVSTAASHVRHWAENVPKSTSLDIAGLVALADLSTLARRTALTGSASYFDILLLCPGIHRQQSATSLNDGEFPATAALTTGYAFRIENQATVSYLQKVGRTGHLVTLKVFKTKTSVLPVWQKLSGLLGGSNTPAVSFILLLTAALLTLIAIAVLILAEDYWGLSILFMLMFARLCNVLIIRQRSTPGWKGASEPGVHGDLLVLLSQDRWIRIQGLVDDVKAVTSGQWLHDMNFIESSVVAAATLMVYLAAALASNASQLGKIIFLGLLLISVGMLAISNELVKELQMCGCIVKMVGEPVKYARRLDLADQLIKESGRKDWAYRLGMIVEEVDGKDDANVVRSKATM